MPVLSNGGPVRRQPPNGAWPVTYYTSRCIFLEENFEAYVYMIIDIYNN